MGAGWQRAVAAARATQKPKGITAKLRARKKRQQAKPNGAVYAWVTARDPICRGCHSRPATQRHHLRGRGWTTREDVCGVCDDCHDELHVRIGGKTLMITGNAETRSAYSDMPCGLTVIRLVPGHGWVIWCDR